MQWFLIRNTIKCMFCWSFSDEILDFFVVMLLQLSLRRRRRRRRRRRKKGDAYFTKDWKTAFGSTEALHERYAIKYILLICHNQKGKKKHILECCKYSSLSVPWQPHLLGIHYLLSLWQVSLFLVQWHSFFIQLYTCVCARRFGQ